MIDKGLLIHWWHYYGKCIYTFAELEEFEKIIEQFGADKVFDVAVASYICGDGSPTVLLVSIREQSVEELFETLPDIESMEEKEKKLYEDVKKEFLEIITSTYK